MAVLGNGRKVYLVPASGNISLYSYFAGELSNNLNRSAEETEASDKSSEWAQFLSGTKGATAEVTVYLDDLNDFRQDHALEALMTAADPLVKVIIGEKKRITSNGKCDVFTAIVTAISDTNDNGSVSTRTISLTATGEVTHYPSLS